MSENVTQADREREFGRAVVLDTDLRKLHAEGRTSDAIRRINDALRAAEIAAGEKVREAALAFQPCTAEDPNESDYHRAFFNGVIEVMKVIRALDVAQIVGGGE